MSTYGYSDGFDEFVDEVIGDVALDAFEEIDEAAPRRGSYWASGEKVFPTGVTAQEEVRRVRGKGRGGRTIWGRSHIPVRELQKQWVSKRAGELRRLTPDLARRTMEGQILTQKRNPERGFIKGLLDKVFGPKVS